MYGLYVDEVATIQHALSRAGRTKKTALQEAKGQNPQLRDFYQHKYMSFVRITLFSLMIPM
jgi:hypothetical protein